MKDIILEMKIFIQNHKVLWMILVVFAIIGLTIALLDGRSGDRWLSLP